MTYTTDRLWQEVVYVAYYLHWPLADILDLPHPDRVRVISGIGDIHNQRRMLDDSPGRTD